MSQPIYDRAIATAARLIAKYGQQIVWNANTNTAPVDPSQPWKPAAISATSNYPYIVFLPENRIGYEFLAALVGTEVPQGCVEGLMPGNVGFVPTSKDTIVRNGVTMAIETIDVIAPNGTPVLYVIRFKK